MKITLLLCLTVALTGCATLHALFHKQSGRDSPIIVSDGSTKIHHKDLQENGSTVTVQDAGFSVTTLECRQGFSCGTTKLLPGWTLTTYDGQGSLIATITSSDNSSVSANFGSNAIDPPQTDTDSENVLGKVVETHSKSLTFHALELTNGKGGTNIPRVTCSHDKPCRVRIHYYQP